MKTLRNIALGFLVLAVSAITSGLMGLSGLKFLAIEGLSAVAFVLVRVTMNMIGYMKLHRAVARQCKAVAHLRRASARKNRIILAMIYLGFASGAMSLGLFGDVGKVILLISFSAAVCYVGYIQATSFKREREHKSITAMRRERAQQQPALPADPNADLKILQVYY